MFVESLTTILFRLLNFAALIGLFAFLFKKYMKHDIEQSIEHDRLEEINMNTRIGEGAHRGSELSASIIQQEKLSIHLVARADQWKIAFEKDIQEKGLKQHALQQKIAERTKRQAQTIAQERVMQAVLPHAIQAARKQLTLSFASEAKSKEFVQRILAHMKKSI